MEEPTGSTGRTHSLVYGVDDRMPAGTAVLVSLQQVAAMVVGVITPALILVKPLPKVVVLGNLSDRQTVLFALRLSGGDP